VIPLAQEIAQIRPQILESIRNQRNSLTASKANLTANSSVFSSMLNTVPQKERELAEISRQQAIKSNVYSFLLQKREQTALAVSSTVSDGKVLDTAVSSGKPVSPKIPFIYLAAVFAALIIGAAFISAKEVLNRKILFRSEIESFTTLPVVAEISTVKKKQSLLDNNSKVSLVAEQFRQLRAAIGLYGKHAHDKKLLVTSSISGEGKSYISTNLAMSLALSGKKVVLIDLDVRNPKVSYMLGVKDKPGIADFLTGSKSKEEIINSTSYPNLFVIGAGENAEHARELILEGRLNDLLLQIEDGFDFIVMDTSPIEPVSDAYVLGRYCDRTLFVVRHGYTPKNMVQLFDENSKIQGLKNPVIVFNDVHSRGFLNRTNGYGYGYGYASVYRERIRKEDKKSLEL
jgi:capsular exopolysaccharide synthesis family protein